MKNLFTFLSSLFIITYIQTSVTAQVCTDPNLYADNCDFDGDGVLNIDDLDDDNDGVLDTDECTLANRVGYVDFAGWPALTDVYSVPYPNGGSITVNTVKSYSQNGVPTTYNHSDGDIAGVSFPRAFEGESLGGNYSGSVFGAEYEGTVDIPTTTQALNLLRSLNPQTNRTFVHEVEIDFSTTTLGTTDNGSLIAVGGFYPDALGWNNEIKISAYYPDGTLETDYSQWTVLLSDVNTSQTGGGIFSTPWESATNTISGVILDPVDNPAGYTGSQDARWAQLQVPDGANYEKIVIERTLVAATGYYDFEYWALAVGYEYTTSDCDTDGDGIPNNFDLDSDGDGCSDSYEAGAILTETTDHQFADIDANDDGLVDAVDAGNDGFTDYVMLPYAYSSSLNLCADTDNDGIPDLVDLDDDNDGILDHVESPDCYYTEAEILASFTQVGSDLEWNTTYPITNAYDGNTATFTQTNPINQDWVGQTIVEYSLLASVPISSFTVNASYMSSGIATFTLQGFDGTNWVD